MRSKIKNWIINNPYSSSAIIILIILTFLLWILTFIYNNTIIISLSTGVTASLIVAIFFELQSKEKYRKVKIVAFRDYYYSIYKGIGDFLLDFNQFCEANNMEQFKDFITDFNKIKDTLQKCKEIDSLNLEKLNNIYHYYTKAIFNKFIKIYDKKDDLLISQIIKIEEFDFFDSIRYEIY